MTSEPSAREHPAQRAPGPDVDLRGFPVRRLAAGTVVFRAHRAVRGPWWFSSDGSGRFDLAAPRGTCYVAESAIVAVRERIGVVLGMQRQVPAAVLSGVVVSRLALAELTVVANLRAARAAEFGVLNELATMVPYDVPQAWARSLDAAGLHGARYPARFSTGRAGSIAIFGAAGDRADPVDPEPVPASTIPGAPVSGAPPRLQEITVVPTPRRRTGRAGRAR